MHVNVQRNNIRVLTTKNSSLVSYIGVKHSIQHQHASYSSEVRFQSLMVRLGFIRVLLGVT